MGPTTRAIWDRRLPQVLAQMDIFASLQENAKPKLSSLKTIESFDSLKGLPCRNRQEEAQYVRRLPTSLPSASFFVSDTGGDPS